MNTGVFRGTVAALLTPCKGDRTPDFDARVHMGQKMIATGMSGVVHRGSCGG